MTLQKIGLVGDSAAMRAFVQLVEASDRGVELVRWCPPDLFGESSADEQMPPSLEDPSALRHAPLLVVDVPVLRLARPLASRLGAHVTGRHALVHLSRAIEPETLCTFSEILLQETPCRRIGLVTGPMRLDDVEEGQAVAAVCASSFPEVHELIEAILVSSHCRLYRGKDLMGAEVAAAHCRVLSVIFGLAEAMGLGNSITAVLLARGLAEVSRLAEARGGQRTTAFGMAGAGNLYADIQPEGSVDFQMGCHIIRSGGADRDDLLERFGLDAEELLAQVDALSQAARQARLELHILEACRALTDGDYTPQAALQMLMALPVLDE